jgi:hypothetical protein
MPKRRIPQFLSLLPLSGLKSDAKAGFLQAVFDSRLGRPAEPTIGKDLAQAMLTGGYPRNAEAGRSKATPDMGRDYVKAVV